jgi:hypothetical protein
MKFTSTSSHVSHVEYHPDKKQMSVTFKNGDTYHYSGVSLEDYNLFKNAKSHGKHINSHIKDKFLYTKGNK